MRVADRLRVLAGKCDDLAKTAATDEIRKRHASMAASYRRMADREEWLDAQISPFAKEARGVSAA